MMLTSYSTDFFQFNRFCMQLAGVWPINYDQKWKNTFFSIYNVYTKLYCLVYFILAETIFLIVEGKGDIRMISKCFSWIMNHMIIHYKTMLWYWKRPVILGIIEELNKPEYLFESIPKEFEPAVTLKDFGRMNYLFVSAHFLIGGLIPVTACLGSIISLINDPNSLNEIDNNGNEVYCKNLPFPSWIPYEINNAVKCGFASFIQSNAICTFGYMIISLDGMCTSLMSFLTAHFTLLQAALRSLRIRALKKITLHKKHENYEQELQYIENLEMNKCIHYMQTLFDMCRTLESIYKYQTLVQGLVTLNVFCIDLYLVSTISLNDKTFLSEIMYMVAVGTELSLYCWFGNELTLSSENMLQAIYDSDWTEFSEKVKRSVLITQIRLKKPVILTLGGFSPLTLTTLLAIFKASYSFFAVLKQVNE